MKKKHRIITLCVALLMMVAAAITVNKSVFGYDIRQSSPDTLENYSAVDNAVEVEDGVSVIHTKNLPGCINGYAGPVPLDIYVSSDGLITDIKSLPNEETPSFFERASVLLSSWIGKSPEDAVSLHVDGISGATYSSAAIINNVNVGLSYYIGSEKKSSDAMPLKTWVAFAVTLAACVVPLVVKNKFYRNIQLIANVIVLGFWCGCFLDYYLILKYVSEGIAWPMVLVAGCMLIAAFIYPLFGRPQHYCNHICPFGSAQILLAEICGYKIKLSKGVINILNWFRKILWAALMLLLWTDCLTEWMDLELFQAFQFKSASLGIIIAAVVFMILSLVVSRPYCRFVCPTGSLFKFSENID